MLCIETAEITDFDTSIKLCRHNPFLAWPKITGKRIRIFLRNRRGKIVLKGKRFHVGISESICDREVGSSFLAFTWKEFKDNHGLQNIPNGKYIVYLMTEYGEEFCHCNLTINR